MTDRELLELAAKAAGLKIHHWSTILPGPMMVDPVTDDCGGYWNPLDEDGDALRLANRTGTCIEFGYCSDDAPIVRCGPIEERDNWPEVGNFPDSGKATRRAIVEAVAAMQQKLDDALGVIASDGSQR